MTVDPLAPPPEGQTASDFRPRLDDQPLDPETVGGSVDRLVLTPTGGGAPLADVGPAVRRAPGVYRFTYPTPPDGTYDYAVYWTPRTDEQQVVENGTITYPLPVEAPEGFVVSPAEVGRRLGMTPEQITAHEPALLDVIDDVTADVEGRLGRPVMPVLITDTLPWNPEGWDYSVTPVIERLSATAREDGEYDVTYRAGINAATDPAYRPIRRYITAAAAEAFRVSPPGVALQLQRVRSMSVEGQSITYDTPSAGALGGVPDFSATCGRFRLRGVFSRPRYSGGGLAAYTPGYVENGTGYPVGGVLTGAEAFG